MELCFCDNRSISAVPLSAARRFLHSRVQRRMLFCRTKNAHSDEAWKDGQSMSGISVLPPERRTST